VQDNRNLSTVFWIDWLGVRMPQAAAGAGGLPRLGHILLRESPGIVLLTAYFVLLPLALVKCSKSVRQTYQQLGFPRFLVLAGLLLIMALLPIKMIARWTSDLQYFIAIPEYFLNF
jgi:hypothetical protein